MRQMEYDAADRVTSLTNESGSHSEFTWDVLLIWLPGQH